MPSGAGDRFGDSIAVPQLLGKVGDEVVLDDQIRSCQWREPIDDLIEKVIVAARVRNRVGALLEREEVGLRTALFAVMNDQDEEIGECFQQQRIAGLQRLGWVILG